MHRMEYATLRDDAVKGENGLNTRIFPCRRGRSVVFCGGGVNVIGYVSYIVQSHPLGGQHCGVTCGSPGLVTAVFLLSIDVLEICRDNVGLSQ